MKSELAGTRHHAWASLCLRSLSRVKVAASSEEERMWAPFESNICCIHIHGQSRNRGEHKLRGSQQQEEGGSKNNPGRMFHIIHLQIVC